MINTYHHTHNRTQLIDDCFKFESFSARAFNFLIRTFKIKTKSDPLLIVFECFNFLRSLCDHHLRLFRNILLISFRSEKKISEEFFGTFNDQRVAIRRHTGDMITWDSSFKGDERSEIFAISVSFFSFRLAVLSNYMTSDDDIIHSLFRL